MSRPSCHVPSRPPFVLAHQTDAPESHRRVAADGPLVVGRRVDGDAMVAALVDEPADQQVQGLTPEAAALQRLAQEDVDAGVAVVGLRLLVVVDAAGDRLRRLPPRRLKVTSS